MNANIIIISAIFASHFATGNNEELLSSFRDIENAIVDGFDAKRYQFPYQVSLQKSIFENFQHICGGSIISPTFIITAGHCVITDSKYNTLRVVAGLLKLNELHHHNDVQIIDIIRVFPHPDYESDKNLGVAPNDIGLVKLAKKLDYTKAVKPILLPEPGSEPKGIVQLSGWGSTMDMVLYQKYPEHLKHAILNLMPHELCKIALDKTMGESSKLTPTMICTGSPLGTTSGCFGDSGGPIQQNNRLIGVTSWVVRPCGTMGAPTMYTKISYYIYFIREIVDDL